jgi:hypothetical protein
VSPNSKALIGGRAIQGAGGAGVTGGAGVNGGVYTILAFIVPPAKVATYMGSVGAIYSLASVIRPFSGESLHNDSPGGGAFISISQLVELHF